MGLVGTVEDAFGDRWDVSEVRDTPHPFSIYLGYPAGRKRGPGGPGGKRVILTRELVGYLERHRRNRFDAMALPIGSTAIKRLRKLLGHNRRDDAADWWEARLGDLSSLTIAAFAAAHGVKAGAVERARLSYLGKTNRPTGWYREQAVRDRITSDDPAVVVAEELGVAVGAVGRLRSILKAEGSPVVADYRERIARAKRGVPAHPSTRKGLLRAARREKSRAHRHAIGMALRDHWADGPRPRKPVSADDRPWTDREDRMLGKTLDRVVAGILGRSLAAVRSRRKALGISKSRHAVLAATRKPRSPSESP